MRIHYKFLQIPSKVRACGAVGHDVPGVFLLEERMLRVLVLLRGRVPGRVCLEARVCLEQAWPFPRFAWRARQMLGLLLGVYLVIY